VRYELESLVVPASATNVTTTTKGANCIVGIVLSVGVSTTSSGQIGMTEVLTKLVVGAVAVVRANVTTTTTGNASSVFGVGSAVTGSQGGVAEVLVQFTRVSATDVASTSTAAFSGPDVGSAEVLVHCLLGLSGDEMQMSEESLSFHRPNKAAFILRI
jgi:hypothetical protein